jgi:small-conductance mechanosensitive channel
MELSLRDWQDVSQIIKDSTLLQVLITLIVAIIVHVILRSLISQLIERTVRHRKFTSKVDEHKQEQTLKGVLSTMAGIIVWIVAFLVVLTQLGVNLGALLTSAGLIGVIFGFGAQSVIKDFVSGMFIIGENHYRVGDIIELQVGSQMISGTVEDLTIRITRLRDLDGNLHVVSNGSALSVTNLSYKYANVNVDVTVTYDTDIDEVERIINEVGQKMTHHETLGQSIYEPIQFLRISEFTDKGMCIKALGRVEPAAQWEISGEYRRRLKKAFDKAGIVIAIPHIVVQNLADVATQKAPRT